jgi:hypothetical protein
MRMDTVELIRERSSALPADLQEEAFAMSITSWLGRPGRSRIVDGLSSRPLSWPTNTPQPTPLMASYHMVAG